MQRRHFLQLTAVTGAAALGVGYWRLPVAVNPAAVSIEGALQVLDRFANTALASHQGWNPAQVFNHCAQSVDFSMDGYPELKAAWFRSSLGRAAFSVFASRGAMRHPLNQAIPGAPALDQPSDPALALARLQVAFSRFAAHTGALQPHFAYGQLSHAEYAQAHVLHLYNHLSLITPVG
ncbi:MAG: DUF1569 domain-containing protein [Pseudomonadaceae bacterium]|jgi:hypothetical protein|nr:DUF1569 domain-containing protein [Pseudomonadaceae bacterium]